MEYRALTIGLTDELFSGVQSLLIAGNVQLTPSLTVRDAGHLLTQETFHLLIVDLEYLRSIGQTEWLTGIRRISFIPVIVLSDTPELDLHTMVQLGAGGSLDFFDTSGVNGWRCQGTLRFTEAISFCRRTCQGLAKCRKRRL